MPPVTFDLTLAEIGTGVGLIVAVGTGAVWLLRHRLASDFAPRAEAVELRASIDRLSSRIGTLEAHIAALETRVAAVPTHAETAGLVTRVADVERSVASVQRDVAVAAADIRGVREGMARMEHMLDLLVQHHIGDRTSA